MRRKNDAAAATIKNVACAPQISTLHSFPCSFTFFAHHPHNDIVALFHFQTKFEKFAIEQSKYGFAILDDALTLFNQVVQMRSLPSIVQFNQLLGAVVRIEYYSTAISLYKNPHGQAS
uniref:Uncharacterized protein n=1 Tax=Davidia involucrata TaxID=16924 RepID=A0A5B7BYT5_DAVIN